MNLLDWKVDDRRILINEESIFGETFDIKNHKFRQSCDLKALHEVVLVGLILLLRHAVKLRQQLIKIHLRDDVLAKFIDEQRRWRQIAVQVKEVGRFNFLLILVSGQQKLFLYIIAIDWRNPSRVNFHFAQERFVDDARVWIFVASHLPMELMKEPREEIDRIALLDDLEPLVAPQHNSLEHLVRRYMSFEVPWIPQLSHQLAKPLDQCKRRISRWSLDFCVIRLHQEEVSDGLNM